MFPCKAATISVEGKIIVLTESSINNSTIWKSEPYETELTSIGILVNVYYDEGEYFSAVNRSLFFYAFGMYSY